MKVLIVLGSRDPEGHTARAAQALTGGVVREGGACEPVFLTEQTVERCRQCDSDGWGRCRTEGRCVIEDDFAQLADRIRQSDIVAFATPVYFGDLSESTRAFLDRLRRVCRHDVGKQGILGKPALGVCVAGGGGGGAPACALSLERALSTCGFEVVDMVPVRRQNLELKQEVLHATGRWLANWSRPA